MRRTVILLGLVLVLFLLASCASFSETWNGPTGKATPVCDPKPGVGTGFEVNGQEFIPVGYYVWRDVKGKEYREMVYVKRPAGKDGAK